MDEAPEVRQKRLRMRCWRRGTKEMDLILGPFGDAALAALEPEMLDRLEALLSENDQELYCWISGREQVPPLHQPVVLCIREYHGLN
jgi:antitoxin CptB